jgi:hypothetical protein
MQGETYYPNPNHVPMQTHEPIGWQTMGDCLKHKWTNFIFDQKLGKKICQKCKEDKNKRGDNDD